ncbi:WD40 repeat-like protein [Linderina pennispora]|uniref:WD40 repeat-like protein n=1 Tax=Linderina pennispora TaxID=61395 RepID=A0A1Y1WMR3_9FUNG|nr:WD40 repeat-like protein [Linderina pennispora]ORX74831.1 WD40 repeat-like protein [Linderina pennispora]
MVNPGDYLPSDEEIDIEMFDSDTELSKSLTALRQQAASTRAAAKEDSDSDFETTKPKRGAPASKRGRGRGRGRGAGTAAGRTRNAAEEEDPDNPKPKPRRGRPPKPKTDDGEYGAPKKRAAKGKGKARQTTLDDIKGPAKPLVFDPAEIAALKEQYPDQYWTQLTHPASTDASDPMGGPIDYIDEEHPLELIPTNIADQMALTGIALSPDGTLLATLGSSGQIHIWDTESFECLATLRDKSEPNIDEFFVGQFTPTGEYLVVGGKLKDRKRWSEADEDNHILPCPLKIFNVLTGEVVARLEGHAEEILSVKGVVYKGENYFVTTSQDGYIRRWHMDSSWIVLLEESKEITDGVTCMAFTVSFVPSTGNRFFLASTDDHVTLMDLERCVIVQRFDPIYSSYCDCGKFIEPVEKPLVGSKKYSIIENDDATNGATTSEAPVELPAPSGPYAYFVTRGVELLDAEDNTVSSRPNTCTLHRLVYPTEPDGKFELQEIRRYYNEDYLSNSWLIRIASNGRYLLAPTLNGQVFAFHIATGKVTGILRDHDTIEVRDCKFHPSRKLLFTCSDDGTVKVYKSVYRPKGAMKAGNGCAEDVEMAEESVAASTAVTNTPVAEELKNSNEGDDSAMVDVVSTD